MATSWDAIRKNVARALSDAAGVSISEEDLVAPPDPKLGDIAFGCFKLAKIKAKNPAEIAKELVGAIGRDHSIESASAAGPYVNVKLRAGDVIGRVVKEVEEAGEKYGEGTSGKKKDLMLEYAQPNTHKEIHVGHLRNLVLGASLIHLLKASGWKVVAASYHGDVGAHVAKCLWLLIKKGGVKAIPKEQRTGKYLGALYAEANKMVEDDPDLKTEVSDVQRKLEAHDPELEKIWKETREWSLEEMNETFKELEAPVDRQYLESEVVDEGQRIVDQLLKKKIAKESQGAIIVDLEDVKLGAFLIRKSDGTSLYATKDLALAHLKAKEYPKLSRSLLLVDNRQSLYFKHLFETLKRMGFKTPMEFTGYEFVTLKTGAMSSRDGNIVTWEGFRDEAMGALIQETKKRHPEWDEKRLKKTAHALMLGGVKFGMLKQDGDKIIVFDMEQALAFDGATGPYIQYAATRLGSILEKAGKSKGGDPSILSEPAEKRLALCIAQLPVAVERAASDLRPAVLAQWCLDMATKTNEFYRDVKVLDSDPDLQAARLRLVTAARIALTNGLNLLGIPLPDEM